MTTARVFAPAKINLALHITGQRDDGYHLIDSLVAFADIGDYLTIAAADQPTLKVTGLFAHDVPDGPENLVRRAAQLAAPGDTFAFELEKHLPAAAGIGGGSADAAALLRGLSALGFGAHQTAIETATLGADVPMCLQSGVTRAKGIGEDLTPVPGFPNLPAVLVNPRRSVPTPPVFAALAEKANPGLPEPLPDAPTLFEAITWVAAQRNDLAAPAIQQLPLIAEVTEALARTPHCAFARMSGSGATVFGLFPEVGAAEVAAAQIAQEHPDWWVRACTLGNQSSAAAPRLS
ncbi:MAG: 4-(cytidine 5'-diphospho)-2-C-methyl-D-erythritol kinase [Pseudomonadota bacterium]